jgi:anti-repressor protein
MHQNDSSFSKIIPVSSHAELNQVVDARELWVALKSKQRFSDWLKNRFEETQAVENVDFAVLDDGVKLCRSELESNLNRIDYAITLDTAKHIAMLERSDIGRQIRQYFIEAEKKTRVPAFDLSDPVSVLTYALEQAKIAQAAKGALETAAPKALAFEQFMDASGTYSLTQAAKILGTGVVRLCTILRDAGVLMSSQANWNVPYQQHVDCGRFEIKTGIVEIKGESRVTFTTRVTAKGIEFIRALLEKEQAA